MGFVSWISAGNRSNARLESMKIAATRKHSSRMRIVQVWTRLQWWLPDVSTSWGGGGHQVNKFEQVFSGDHHMSLAWGPHVKKFEQVSSDGHQISVGCVSYVGGTYNEVRCIMGNIHMGDLLSWTDRQTDKIESVTLSQLRWRAVKMILTGLCQKRNWYCKCKVHDTELTDNLFIHTQNTLV